MSREVMQVLLLGAAVLAIATPAAAAPPAKSAGWQVTVLPVVAGATASFAEPGIASGPNGVLMVNASTANTGAPPTFWSSADAGGTWARGRDLTGGVSSGDADTAIARDGYRYVLNLGYGANPPAQPSNPTVMVYRSADGTAWQGPAAFPAPHGLDQPDRPWLLSRPSHPAEVYVFNSEGGGNLVAWHSSDHGATFAGPVPVTGGVNSQAAITLGSRPLFDPTDDSRIYMLYATASAAAVSTPGATGYGPYEFPLSQLWLATSTDAGQTWSNALALDAATAFGTAGPSATLAHLLPGAAIDHAGNLYVVLSVRTGAGPQTHLFLVNSGDRGKTWGNPTRIDIGNGSNVMPAVAASGTGSLWVSWYGSASVDFRDPSAAWTEMYAQTTSALATVPAFSTGPVGGPDPVHVGGVDSAGAIGSDAGANWGLRDFQGITVDSCDRPHLAWAVDFGGNRTVTATTTARCPVATAPAPGSDGGLPATGAGAPEWLGAWVLAVLALALAGVVVARRPLRRAGARHLRQVPDLLLTRVHAKRSALRRRNHHRL
jgi:hypothetical protein